MSNLHDRTPPYRILGAFGRRDPRFYVGPIGSAYEFTRLIFLLKKHGHRRRPHAHYVSTAALGDHFRAGGVAYVTVYDKDAFRVEPKRNVLVSLLPGTDPPLYGPSMNEYRFDPRDLDGALAFLDFERSAKD